MVKGDEGGVGEEALALEAVALDELLAVAVAEGVAEALAGLAVSLPVLDVVAKATGGEGRQGALDATE